MKRHSIPLAIRYIITKCITPFVNLHYRVKNKKLIIGYGTRILGGSSFEGYNKIANHSIFKGRLGFASYIGSQCNINAIVGKYCSIGDDVIVLSSRHPVHKFVSTHPMFYSTNMQNGHTYVKQQLYEERYCPYESGVAVRIGNDCFIGSHTIIMAGVTVGNGAVIGAGAVVTKDVEPYSIVAGVPAIKIGERFPADKVQIVEKSKWWEQSKEWLEENVDMFKDIEIFTEKCEEKIG